MEPTQKLETWGLEVKRKYAVECPLVYRRQLIPSSLGRAVSAVSRTAFIPKWHPASPRCTPTQKSFLFICPSTPLHEPGKCAHAFWFISGHHRTYRLVCRHYWTHRLIIFGFVGGRNNNIRVNAAPATYLFPEQVPNPSLSSLFREPPPAELANDWLQWRTYLNGPLYQLNH